MTKNAESEIIQGPSKMDLMLSLFDTDLALREVAFTTGEKNSSGTVFHGPTYRIQITSARRRNPAANTWEIEGITDAQGGKMRVSIYYLSDTREGRMRFKEKLRTHGIMETPDDAKRARALMIVIEKMIVKYQNSHRGNLDEGIFKLYEKAKPIHWAKDHKSLAEAINNI